MPGGVAALPAQQIGAVARGVGTFGGVARLMDYHIFDGAPFPGAGGQGLRKQLRVDGDAKDLLRVDALLRLRLVAVHNRHHQEGRHDHNKNKDGYCDGPSAPCSTP